MLAVWIGTGSIVGNAGKTYEVGMAALFLPLGTFVGMILLFISIVTYGQWILVGVIEEKSSRVVEVVLGAVRPHRGHPWLGGIEDFYRADFRCFEIRQEYPGMTTAAVTAAHDG